MRVSTQSASHATLLPSRSSSRSQQPAMKAARTLLLAPVVQLLVTLSVLDWRGGEHLERARLALSVQSARPENFNSNLLARIQTRDVVDA